jgi:hypothetical protein
MKMPFVAACAAARVTSTKVVLLLLGAVAFCLVGLGNAGAGTVVIGFDDIPDAGTIVGLPTGYQGFNWGGDFGNLTWVITNGTTGALFPGLLANSSPNYAWTNGAGGLTLTSATSPTFDFDSLWMRGLSPYSVTVEGFDGASMIYSQTLSLTTTFQLFNLDFLGITEWALLPQPNTTFLDTFTLNVPGAATPLPAALPLFATGLGALGLFGWRRKRNEAAALAAVKRTVASPLLGAKVLRLNYISAICLLALSVGVAKADTLITFDVTGSFASPATSLTGTLTVDATLATVTEADLVVGTIPDHFNMVISTTALAAPNGYRVLVNNDVPDQLSIDLDNLSLTTGGAITAGSVFPTCPPADPGCIIFNFSELAGSLTGTFAPAVAATPLPAALPLFATGLGALGLFGWRRRQRAQALAT